MAPEQAAGRMADVDALADLWSVGATMFQLLTDRVVHDSSSSNGAVVAAATTPAPRIRTIVPEVSEELARVVDRALAFEREERWPNARAMRHALMQAFPEFVTRCDDEAISIDTELEVAAVSKRATGMASPWSGKRTIVGPLVLALPIAVSVLAWGNHHRAGAAPAANLQLAPAESYTSNDGAQLCPLDVGTLAASTQRHSSASSIKTPFPQSVRSTSRSVGAQTKPRRRSDIDYKAESDDSLLDRRQ